MTALIRCRRQSRWAFFSRLIARRTRARGDVALGIVYHSDAVSEPAVREVDRFPADAHPPIVYPVAALRGARAAQAARLTVRAG